MSKGTSSDLNSEQDLASIPTAQGGLSRLAIARLKSAGVKTNYCCILLTLAVFAVTGFVLLVLIGLWDRYEKEITALGFRGPYERHLASQAGFLNDPKAYHGAMFERARQGVVGPDGGN